MKGRSKDEYPISNTEYPIMKVNNCRPCDPAWPQPSPSYKGQQQLKNCLYKPRRDLTMLIYCNGSILISIVSGLKSCSLGQVIVPNAIRAFLK